MQEERIPRARLTVAHCSLGSAVRELRARYGLSQEGLGQKAGLHRNYVGAIERGEINPTFLTLLRLSAGIEIRLSGLIVLYERHEKGFDRDAKIGSAHP